MIKLFVDVYRKGITEKDITKSLREHVKKHYKGKKVKRIKIILDCFGMPSNRKVYFADGTFYILSVNVFLDKKGQIIWYVTEHGRYGRYTPKITPKRKSVLKEIKSKNRVDTIIRSAMKKFNMPKSHFSKLRKAVLLDYEESDIRKLTINDVVEIYDASFWEMINLYILLK